MSLYLASVKLQRSYFDINAHDLTVGDSLYSYLRLPSESLSCILETQQRLFIFIMMMRRFKGSFRANECRIEKGVNPI